MNIYICDILNTSHATIGIMQDVQPECEHETPFEMQPEKVECRHKPVHPRSKALIPISQMLYTGQGPQTWPKTKYLDYHSLALGAPGTLSGTIVIQHQGKEL